MHNPPKFLLTLWFSLVLACTAIANAQSDPLPSWNDTSPKQAIIGFVDKVTKPGNADFVPPEDRIATFDNDGTLWVEQPMYVQLASPSHE